MNAPVVVLRDSSPQAVIIPSGPRGGKGDPGANVMAIGLFADASGLAIPAGTDTVRTSGYSALGVGIADYVADVAVDAAYVAAHPRSSFISLNGRGFRINIGDVVKARAFGSDSTGLQEMFNLVCATTSASIHKEIDFKGADAFTITSTVTIPDPSNLRVNAWGVKFTTPNDILMFDFNGRADPTFVDNESRQNFHWHGGSFYCTYATPTKASSARMLGFRYASFYPQLIDGFYHAVIFGAKDTVWFGKCKISNTQLPVIQPPWSAIGGSLKNELCGIHFAHKSTTTLSAIRIYGQFSDSRITGNSYNLSTNAAHDGVIDLIRAVLLPCASVTGTFTVGETLTATNGATGVFVELYTHQFPFQIAQPMQYLVLSNKSATDFVAGQTVTGATGSAVLTSTSAHLMNDPTIAGCKIGDDDEHWEAGSGALGVTCIRIRDLIKRGTSLSGMKINAGDLGVNAFAGSTAIGIDLQRVRDSTITGKFAQTTLGPSIPIKLDIDCQRIKICRPSTFSSGTISFACPRSEVDLSDYSLHNPGAGQIVTGYNALSVPAGATAAVTVDMKTAFPSIQLIGGVGPKSYNALMSLRGTTAATGTDVRARVYHPAETLDQRIATLQIGGRLSSKYHSLGFDVGADANAAIKIDFQNDGGGTVLYTLLITGQNM